MQTSSKYGPQVPANANAMWRPRPELRQLQVVGRVLLVAFVPLVTLMKNIHRKNSEAKEIGERIFIWN